MIQVLNATANVLLFIDIIKFLLIIFVCVHTFRS